MVSLVFRFSALRTIDVKCRIILLFSFSVCCIIMTKSLGIQYAGGLMVNTIVLMGYVFSKLWPFNVPYYRGYGKNFIYLFLFFFLFGMIFFRFCWWTAVLHYFLLIWLFLVALQFFRERFFSESISNGYTLVSFLVFICSNTFLFGFERFLKALYLIFYQNFDLLFGIGLWHLFLYWYFLNQLDIYFSVVGTRWLK